MDNANKGTEDALLLDAKWDIFSSLPLGRRNANYIDGIELDHVVAEDFVGYFVADAKLMSQVRLMPRGVSFSLLQPANLDLTSFCYSTNSHSIFTWGRKEGKAPLLIQ